MGLSRIDNTVDMTNEEILKRLLKKVRKTDSCWLWRGRVSGGYGVISLKGKQFVAHRVMWAVSKGGLHLLLPGKNMICHECNIKLCMNPEHLYQGTGKNNAADRRKDGMKGWRTVLTEQDVLWMRAYVIDFSLEKRKEVAEKFGIRKETVDQIIRGITWKHLLPPTD